LLVIVLKYSASEMKYPLSYFLVRSKVLHPSKLTFGHRYEEVVGGIKRYQELVGAAKSSRVYQEVRRGSRDYQEVPRGTTSYQEVPRGSKS
jgi:hypothetical protein